MIAGRRVAVVGASAGIGRAFAVQAAKDGADVVLASRRRDVLDAAVAEAGAGTAVPLDVCDPGSRRAFVRALRGGPPVDLVLVTVGVADLRPLAATDEAAWTAMLSTNLLGVARLVDELRPVLAEEGVLAVLSSETARRPRRGLVPYAATKAALETFLAGCRVEHPGLRVSCVVVGATFPTDFGSGFESEHLVPALEEWQRRGELPERMMTPEDVAAVLLDLYGAALRHPGVNVDEIVLRSPSPALGGPLGGPLGGHAGGQVDGTLDGPIDGHAGGTLDGPIDGHAGGQVDGPIDGPLGGHAGGQVDGTLDGQMGGPIDGPIGGSIGEAIG